MLKSRREKKKEGKRERERGLHTHLPLHVTAALSDGKTVIDGFRNPSNNLRFVRRQFSQGYALLSRWISFKNESWCILMDRPLGLFSKRPYISPGVTNARRLSTAPCEIEREDDSAERLPEKGFIPWMTTNGMSPLLSLVEGGLLQQAGTMREGERQSADRVRVSLYFLFFSCLSALFLGLFIGISSFRRHIFLLCWFLGSFSLP